MAARSMFQRQRHTHTEDASVGCNVPWTVSVPETPLAERWQWSGREKSWRFFPAAHRQRSASRGKEKHACGKVSRRQHVAVLRTSLKDTAMPVNTTWAVGVAMLLLILGTPQVSRAEATISFSSRYYYFCWNPSAQGHACSQRSSKKIWTASPVSVEVELRAACQQQHYAQVF